MELYQQLNGHTKVTNVSLLTIDGKTYNNKIRRRIELGLERRICNDVTAAVTIYAFVFVSLPPSTLLGLSLLFLCACATRPRIETVCVCVFWTIMVHV